MIGGRSVGGACWFLLCDDVVVDDNDGSEVESVTREMDGVIS